MLVATFNVNSLRVRLPAVLRWLATRRPDILCLQETKVPDALFPVEEFRAAGYHAVHRCAGPWNGVAVLSQARPAKVRFGLPGGDEEDQTRVIACQIDGLPIVNSYMPQGQTPESERFVHKLSFFDRHLAFFRAEYSPDRPLLWLGDLNVAPEPADVHNPKRLLQDTDFHPAARAKFAEVRDGFGFIDIVRRFHPEPRLFTYWDYRLKDGFKKNAGMRIDHILATPPLAQRARDAFIDLGPRAAERPSDHAPVAAVFDTDGGGVTN